MTRPLFILSLPRSGSTLLQRVLANHPDVATTPEPWVLLPMVYGHTDPDTPAEYDERTCAGAVSEFLHPHGLDRSDLFQGNARETAMRLYGQAADGRGHFLDKTPRYALIASRLIEAFPQAGFVVLWRDPLAVYSSVRETWPYERTGIAPHEIDLYAGLAGLCRVVHEHADRLHALRYEDLVADTEPSVRGVCEHLGLAFDPTMLELRSRDETSGSTLGDQTGRANFATIEQRSHSNRAGGLEGICNPGRVRWCREWIRWIGPERLDRMGYDEADLLRRLDESPLSLRRWWKDAKRERRARGWREERRRAIGRTPMEAAAAIDAGDWPGGTL